jgi:hypothetical protein
MAQAEYVTTVIRSPITGADAKPSTKPVQAAYAEFVAVLVGHSSRPTPVYADAVDLEDRADHLNKVLNAFSAFLTAVLDDTAQNVPGGLELRQVDALLFDLASDVSGILQHAVDRMAWRLA